LSSCLSFSYEKSGILDSEIFDEDHPIHLLPAGIANTIQQQQQSVENNPKSNIQYTAENPLFAPVSNNNESNTNRISAPNNSNPNNNIMTPVNITNRSSTPNQNSGGSSYFPPPHRSSGASGGGGGSSLGDRSNSLGSARDGGGGDRGYSLDSDTSQSPRVGIWEYMFGKELRF
jgi:hypothetical protein